MISYIRNRYETEHPKPWEIRIRNKTEHPRPEDANDEVYFSTKKQFVSYLEKSGIPVKRSKVSRVVQLLYSETSHLPVATIPNSGERNNETESETHVKETSQWWNGIERLTQRMVVNYLSRYRNGENLNSEDDAQNRNHEKASRNFVQDFGPINTNQEENPVSRIFSSFNDIDPKVEIILEDSTDDLVDKTITCLSALSLIPPSTTKLMRSMLNEINSSSLALARRLGKLNLLYDIGCLPFFRSEWVRSAGRSLDALTAVEDSLDAWEGSLRRPGMEGNLEAMVEESDSEHDEFFDFDE